MKIRPEHYEHMKAAIAAIDKDKARAHKTALQDDERVKDLDKRFRWDLSYAASLTPWICDNLYSYLNDTHIDTALKAVVKDLEL